MHRWPVLPMDVKDRPWDGRSFTSMKIVTRSGVSWPPWTQVIDSGPATGQRAEAEEHTLRSAKRTSACCFSTLPKESAVLSTRTI